MRPFTNDQIRQNVRSRYKEIALKPVEMGSSCCEAPVNFEEVSAQLGYSNEELTAVPEGANLGLGCGNPQAIAALQLGEVVLDLGRGAPSDLGYCHDN
jgi:hypothetical protein